MTRLKSSTHEAFCSVVSAYQESRFSSGDLAATDYGRRAASGRATHTGSSQTVTPSTSDLVCDVEISAFRCLSEGELAYWETYYRPASLLGVHYGEEGCGFTEHLKAWSIHLRSAVKVVDSRIREKLGGRFLDAGIAPLALYRAAVDRRGPKPGRGQWSHLYGN